MPWTQTSQGRDSKEKRNCRITTTGPTTVAVPNENRIRVQEVGLFTRANELQGDHIHALPYWSDDVQLRVPDPSKRRINGKYHWWDTNTVNDAIPPDCFKNGVTRWTGQYTLDVDAIAWYTAPPQGWSSIPAVDSSVVALMKQLSETRALARLNTALVNLPMLFKERRETIRMAAGKVSQFARAAGAVQERDLKRFAREKTRKGRRAAAQGIANEHLELVFGWVPLLSEIEGAMEYAERPLLDFIRANATQTQELSTSLVDGTSSIGNDSATGYVVQPLGRVRGLGTLRHVLSVRTALRYNLTTQISADARLLGFEPVSTFYDMVPLSFVSGWFSNFDAYVRTISPLVGLEFVTGSWNRRDRLLLDYSHTFTPSTALQSGIRKLVPEFASRDLGSVTGHRVRNVRSVLDTPPEASLHFGLDVGVFEAAAAASLLIQRYLKPLKTAIKQRPFKYRGPRPRYLPDIQYRSQS